MAPLSPTAAFRPARQVVPAAELGCWRDAAEMLAAARAAASAIRAEAAAAAEQQRQRAVREGHEAGMAAVAWLSAQATTRAAAFLQECETALPDLVADCVVEIIGALDDDEAVARAVAHALTRLRRGAHAVVRVPPDAYAAVRAEIGDVVTVEADPALPPGRCVFSSEYGQVELGIEAQVANLRAVMRTAVAPTI